MKIGIALAVLFLVIAVAIAVHQFIGWGFWWEWEDLHHETWMIMFAFTGIVLLLMGRIK